MASLTPFVLFGILLINGCTYSYKFEEQNFSDIYCAARAIGLTHFEAEKKAMNSLKTNFEGSSLNGLLLSKEIVEGIKTTSPQFMPSQREMLGSPHR